MTPLVVETHKNLVGMADALLCKTAEMLPRWRVGREARHDQMAPRLMKVKCQNGRRRALEMC
jgi:hypothetical protein